jgi:uncharacterized protein YkwD
MRVRPAAQHRATRRRRRSGVLCGILLTPVAVLVAVYLAGGGGFLRLGAASSGPAQASPPASGATGPAARAASPAAPSPSPPPRPAGPARPRPAASRTPATAPASQGPPAAASPPAQNLTAAGQVLALINQARAQAGLAPYTVLSGLDSSAAAHNARMAAGCGLSHQCPGEPPLGTRETDAGVSWTAAGENIGEGGPVPDTASAIAQMAVTLTQDMLDEKPPDDGHRLNILSSTFRFIGIAVSVDSSGTVWMTQDFAD